MPANNFQANVSAAQIAVRDHNLTAAEHFFRAALSQQKNSALALVGLGQCLCQLNRATEGVPLLCQAGRISLKLAKQNSETKYILDIAYQLARCHAPEEALLLAKAALGLDADSANALHIVAMSLQALNKHSEAYTYSLRAVALAPEDANAHIQLAVLEAKLGKLSDAKQRLEWVVAKAGDANLVRAHMELGVVLDKLGEYEPAFTHLAQAGQIALQSPLAARIDNQAVFRDVGQYKAGLDAKFLQSAAVRLPDDGLPSPVFLIGFFRSGTTLAEQILATHSQVVGSDEALIVPAVLNELYKITDPSLTMSARLKSLGATEIIHLRRFYWQTAAQLLGVSVSQQLLVDKTALNILNIELINTLFPNALLIFALRDPRDVCISCFMQPFTLSALTANFLSWTDTAHFYALIMDYWLTIRDNLSVQWLELRYEDVLQDLEGQFRPIFTKMGLEWSPECSEFYRHAQKKVIKTPSFDQVTRPLYRSSVARWRNYEPQLAEILPVLKPYISAFGFDRT